jgi:DNA polymerase-3 subunit alpha
VLDSLIKAGAFDALGHRRSALSAVHVEAAEQYASVKKNQALGQDSLFDDCADAVGDLALSIPDLPEWEPRMLLAYERDMLGLYVSGHPLADLGAALAAQAGSTIASLREAASPPGSTVRLGVLITDLARKTTKKGDPYAVATVEDLTGSIEVMFFPKTYAAISHLLATDAILLVTGRTERRDDGSLSVFASDVSEPNLTAPVGPGGPGSPAPAGPPLRAHLSYERCTRALVDRLTDVLDAHPGPTAVHLLLHGGGRAHLMALGDAHRVHPSAELAADLKALLGPGCLDPQQAPDLQAVA